jgi:transcription-repair coupling factor (superfamily II helicase)
MAMRAAFKAVEAGFQVAVLVPTTVLAEQHRRSFAARFSEFPFVIRSLSRFSSAQEEREVLEGLARKSVDIVIGTHRLAQADIHFANLGLLVVDEEQRFGVDVKEKLKALRASVDVLTMTATPIPRTLHMSMLGIRDISNLTTPPAAWPAGTRRSSRRRSTGSSPGAGRCFSCTTGSTTSTRWRSGSPRSCPRPRSASATAGSRRANSST